MTGGANQGRTYYRWLDAVMEARGLGRLVKSMPGPARHQRRTENARAIRNYNRRRLAGAGKIRRRLLRRSPA